MKKIILLILIFQSLAFSLDSSWAEKVCYKIVYTQTKPNVSNANYIYGLIDGIYYGTSESSVHKIKTMYKTSCRRALINTKEIEKSGFLYTLKLEAYKYMKEK